MTKNNDRELFEAWVKDPINGVNFSLDSRGDVYTFFSTYSHFKAFLAGRASAVPTGFVLAPVEPTKEMLARGKHPSETYSNNAYHCYKAMISAAPLPPEGEKNV